MELKRGWRRLIDKVCGGGGDGDGGGGGGECVSSRFVGVCG